MSKILIVTVAALALSANAASAQSKVECEASESVCKQIQAYASANIQPWLNGSEMVTAVNQQDKQNANLTSAEIEKMDSAWKDKSDKGLIDSKMNSSLSTFLKTKKAGSGGVITEILVFDDKGLNVAQTDASSDYMQGDEDKYKNSFGAGPDAVFIDDVEDDNGMKVSQASMTIKDPSSGKAIGGAMFGINVNKLK